MFDCDSITKRYLFQNNPFASQINHFRKELHHSKKADTGTSEDYALWDNHRLPQELNGRKVFTNVDPKSRSTSTANAHVVSLKVLSVLVVIVEAFALSV